MKKHRVKLWGMSAAIMLTAVVVPVVAVTLSQPVDTSNQVVKSASQAGQTSQAGHSTVNSQSAQGAVQSVVSNLSAGSHQPGTAIRFVASSGSSVSSSVPSTGNATSSSSAPSTGSTTSSSATLPAGTANGNLAAERLSTSPDLNQGFMAPDSSSASLTLQQRVVRLEQQITNLLNLNQAGKIASLQEQLQQLSGQLEVMQHNLKQLNANQRSFYQDLDQRINQIKTLSGSDDSQQTPAKSTSAASSSAASTSSSGGAHKSSAQSSSPQISKSSPSSAADDSVVKPANLK